MCNPKKILTSENLTYGPFDVGNLCDSFAKCSGIETSSICPPVCFTIATLAILCQHKLQHDITEKLSLFTNIRSIL
jgi:hypothetical protein